MTEALAFPAVHRSPIVWTPADRAICSANVTAVCQSFEITFVVLITTPSESSSTAQGGAAVVQTWTSVPMIAAVPAFRIVMLKFSVMGPGPAKVTCADVPTGTES